MLHLRCGHALSIVGTFMQRIFCMRILIVEDEIKTAAYLKKGLMEEGIVADTAHNGEEGLRLALNFEYNLIILDVMLPKRDGWSILQEMRRQEKHTPVLFLTARDKIDDRVKGLNLGADDYLIKPFAFSELLARIQALQRRSPVQQNNLTIADLEIDLLKHKATRSGTAIDLTQKEFTLLSFMVQRRGHVLSRTMISEHVWDMGFDSDTNFVDVAIRRLRSKVDDPFPRKLIHSVRGVGYVLEEREK